MNVFMNALFMNRVLQGGSRRKRTCMNMFMNTLFMNNGGCLRAYIMLVPDTQKWS